MATIYALHNPGTRHLLKVMNLMKMKRRGPPVIRAHWRTFAGRTGWYALEGSHRIAAACRLAYTPKIVPMDLGDEFRHDVSDVHERDVASILDYFDDRHRSDGAAFYWLEYRFPKLRGPRGGGRR